MFFRQIQGQGDNFSYIIADEKACEAAVVDTSYNAAEIKRQIKTGGFKLKYIFCTHGHADHVAGNSEVRSALGGKVVAHPSSWLSADIKVEDGAVFEVGSTSIKVIYTPGHTPDGICLLVDGKLLLTGDTLFVGECGRTDLPGGDSRQLFRSLFGKLMKLPGEVEIYPGHDYGVKPHSTIGEERRTNYVLQPRSVDEFVEFMSQP